MKAVKSVCPYCGVGCGIVMEVNDEQVVNIIGDRAHPSNAGRLCTKGKSCHQAIADSGRLESAYVRHQRTQEPARIDMDAAIAHTAGRLAHIRDTAGADAIALYVSGQMSLEAQYLANKLAKGYLRTRHIESNSRLCMASAGSGYKLSLGADAPPGSYDDFDRADVFLMIGANMADCHPILFLRLMDRVKAGAKLIVVDPRRTASAVKANLYLPIKAGTDLALLNGLLYLLHKHGYTDEAFIREHTEGWDAMPDFLAEYTPEKVAAITGLARADIEKAAHWIGEAGDWMSCWTMGLNQSTHGTWHTNALCNLHLATGAICRPGSGPFSLTGQPNAMGGREMGYMGPGLPGQRSVLNEEDRRFVEARWQLPAGSLRAESGAGTVDMFQAMARGEIKACWIICTNPVATVPNRRRVIEALQQAELVITQDAYLDTETNRYADVLLPAALWAEAEGVMINSERNLTLMQQAVKAPGEALPDWQIIARVACALGYEEAFSYQSAEEIFEEIKGFANPATDYSLEGASYARLRETPLQWPCATADSDSRHPIRYRRNREALRFATDTGRARFFARPCLPPAELPDEDYPLVLNTGRLQHQWHTLTKTGKINTLNKLNPGPFIEINPADARALGIADKGKVKVRSRRGAAELPAVITDRVQPGNCFVPFHWNDVFGENLAINAVTSDAVDAISSQPEFKIAAVSLAAVDETPVDTPATSAPAPQKNTTLAFAPADETSCMTLIEHLSETLALDTPAEPDFTPTENRYLSGYIAGLQASAKHMSALPCLPREAPVRTEHIDWINGLLAGMFSRVLPAPAAGETEPDVVLLWASQTGNAEALAEQFRIALEGEGMVVNCREMCAFSLAELATSRQVLFVTSTFGDGDAPDSGEDFWQALAADNAPKLEGLRYALLALGDSSYDQFCGHGKKLDQRLAALGAEALHPRVDCDTDYEVPASAWLEAVKAKLQKVSAAAPANAPPRTSPAGDLAGTDKPGNSKNNPYPARLVINQPLNQEGSAKDVRCFGFDIGGAEMRYRAGDALGVWPENCPELVYELLKTLKLNADTPVLVDTHEKPLGEALQKHFEIATPSREILALVAEKSKDKKLRDLLLAESKPVLNEWLWGRQLVDIVHEFPLPCSAGELLAALKRLQPRLYSIASSPLLHPDQVHLTVSAVRYPRYSDGKKIRKGVCSTFLADRAAHLDIPVYLQASKHFHLPDDGDTPIIMVGPGTGIAPFRGFLQERQARGDSGKSWLFFGEQHAATDFYYREELEAFRKNGVLDHLSLAFSRDQAPKIYVQDKMREAGEQLWEWLEAGASFYVCGDASRMARDVDNTLREIIAHYGRLDEAGVANYIRKLNMEKRYLRDVY